MVSICKCCRSFKQSYRSKCKRCDRKRRQRGQGFKSLFKKVKGAAKEAAQSDIGKLAISKGLEHLPRLYTLRVLQKSKTKRSNRCLIPAQITV